MKKTALLFLFTIPSFLIFSQGIKFEYSAGYGSFQLTDIKSIQKSIIGMYGLQITDNFPNNFTHGIGFGFLQDNLEYGCKFTYLTTGGRLNVVDYSGSYTIDMIVNGYRLGSYGRFHVKTGLSRLNVFFQLESGGMSSNLKLYEEMKIYNESNQNSNELKGYGFYIEPTLGANIRIANRFNITLYGGYEFDFGGTLKLDNNKTGSKANWNGIRLNCGLSYIIKYNN